MARRARQRQGNCYAATEAAYYILGGPESAWEVYRVMLAVDWHWYLRHRETGVVLDLSRRQFKQAPPYDQGMRANFYTQRPSKRAAELIEALTWA